MASPRHDTRDPHLQIDEDRAHQRLEWRIERVGWAVMAALALAGVLGLLGNGPLGRAHAEGGGLALDYDRLQRAKAPTEYRFHVDPALARDGTLRLRFSDALLEEVEIETIVPEPDSVRAGPGFTEYAFAVARGDRDRAARIALHYRPTTFGPVRGRVWTEGAPPLDVAHFVYP